MGRGLKEVGFMATEVCIVFVTQRCLRTQLLTLIEESSGHDDSHRKDWPIKRREAVASVTPCDVLGSQLRTIPFTRPSVSGWMWW